MTNKESNKKKKIIITILAIIIIIILLLLKCCSKKKDTGSVTQEDTTSTQEVIQNDDKKEEVKEEETKEEVIVIEEEKPIDGYSYYVNFLNIDGSLLQRSVYKKGEIPSYKGSTPTYSAGLSTYTFTGWDKAFTKVSGTQTYTATYNVSAHTCSHYTIQSDGSWLCSECNALLKDTDDAYFTVLDANNQPTTIQPLTATNVTGSNGISKSGTNISYSNNSSTAKDVVIRTSSQATALTINAPNDNVKHYGNAGFVDLQKIASTSYFEYGKVAFVELTIGRIVLTETSDVEVINIEKATANTYYNPIIADGGVLDENMPEIISRDQVNVIDQSGKTKLVQIQQLDNKGSVIANKTEQVYACAYNDGTNDVGTTEKTSTINNDVISTLGQIVLDDTDKAGEKAYTENQKESKIDEIATDANPVVISKGVTSNPVARIRNKGYGTLAGAIAEAVNGDVVVLLKDTTEAQDVTITKEIQLIGTNLGTDNAPDYTTITGAGYATGNGGITGKSGIVINLGSVEAKSNVTIKNLQLINMGNYGAIEVKSSNNSNVNVLIQNITCDTFYRMGISVHGGNVDIDSCTIDSHVIKASVGNGINFDGYGLKYLIKGSVTNCAITNSSQESGKWVSGGIALWDNVDLQIDKCVITNCNTAISPVGEDNKTKVTNTNISNASTCISVNKYLYEDAKTCEVELGEGNNFSATVKAIYVGIGQTYNNNVKFKITGGTYTCNDGYSLVLSDYASYYSNQDAYNLNDYFMDGSSISANAVLNGAIAIAYDAYELSTYEDSSYKVNILNNVGIIPEKIKASDCWYSNGAWNSGSGSENKGLFLITDIFNENWMGSGEGIKLTDNLTIDSDITCQMTSGSFYLYFQGYTLSGGKIILNSGVSVISDTSGMNAVFCGGTIIETDNGNGTYTYAIQNN